MGNVYYTGSLTPSSGPGDNNSEKIIRAMDEDFVSNGQTTESDMFTFTDNYGYKVYLGDDVISELVIS